MNAKLQEIHCIIYNKADSPVESKYKKYIQSCKWAKQIKLKYYQKHNFVLAYLNLKTQFQNSLVTRQ